MVPSPEEDAYADTTYYDYIGDFTHAKVMHNQVLAGLAKAEGLMQPIAPRPGLSSRCAHSWLPLSSRSAEQRW